MMFDFLFEIWVEPRLCFSTGIPSKVSQTMGARIYYHFQHKREEKREERRVTYYQFCGHPALIFRYLLGSIKPKY